MLESAYDEELVVLFEVREEFTELAAETVLRGEVSPSAAWLITEELSSFKSFIVVGRASEGVDLTSPVTVNLELNRPIDDLMAFRSAGIGVVEGLGR